ncbi:general transcription factor II-I repeat domain-containing protein 2-like [Palaemon carinicauda]|uniref:general transcription factor II-I repeat domain-containing protein 2-like n=1 Tax=Palaemon carinicauda TaxID=392227 RepID=UPI0035B59BAF
MEGLKKAPCISLAIDESTDSTDNAQLIVFVRYYDAGEKIFCQDWLGVTDLKGRARGEDIYGSLESLLESRNIDVKSIISVTTDGAPAMVGRERGLVARSKEDNPDMISYHCIIHRSVLCASLGDEYGKVMETYYEASKLPSINVSTMTSSTTNLSYGGQCKL